MAAVALLACGVVLAQETTMPAAGREVIPDRYVVVFKEEIRDPTAAAREPEHDQTNTNSEHQPATAGSGNLPDITSRERLDQLEAKIRSLEPLGEVGSPQLDRVLNFAAVTNKVEMLETRLDTRMDTLSERISSQGSELNAKITALETKSWVDARWFNGLLFLLGLLAGWLTSGVVELGGVIRWLLDLLQAN